MIHKKIVIFSTILAIISIYAIFNVNSVLCNDLKIQSDKPKIVCYFSITQDWCKNLVGDLCDVEVLVSGQQDIHSYDPSADAPLKMDGAALYIRLGIGIEAYSQAIQDSFTSVPVVTLRVDTTVDPTNGVEPIQDPIWTFPDGSHPDNMHFWTSPRFAIKFINRMAQGIEEIIGSSQLASFNNTIDNNLNSYKEKLNQAYDWLQANSTIEPFISMKVCPFHPAFIYFLEDLGVERVAVIEQQPGGTISASHLAEVIDKLNSSCIVLYHPQEEEGKLQAEQVAKDAGANITWLTPLLPIDTPEGLEGKYGAQIDTYLEMLDFNVYQLAHSDVPPATTTIRGFSIIWIFMAIFGIGIILIFKLRFKIKMR
jgi:ABC-type Zn uptake system ZnuABC Zn-binding protein ZnuA